MFKLFLNAFFIFVTLNDGRIIESKDNNNQDGKLWPYLWFPYPTNYQEEKRETATVAETSTTTETNEELSDIADTTSWPGLQFPFPPNYHSDETTKENAKNVPDKINSTGWQELWFPYPSDHRKFIDIKVKRECDNGKYDINMDYDPQEKRHSYNYLCLDEKLKYTPNMNTSALLKEYVVPAAYEPPIKCLNESVEYTQSIPTFGAYRPLAPKFGSYKFLPPQRWLHSLYNGAIVFLYHPCAFDRQIKQLENILKSCLYRHIITPSQLLTPQYPLALLSWGKSLEMSVADFAIAAQFIKENAKMGFRQKQQKLIIPDKFYDVGLLNEAHLVTDEQDQEICGYNEMK